MAGDHGDLAAAGRSGGRLTVPGRREEAAMPGAAKAMSVTTVAALIVVTAYTVGLGGSGWLWFSWVILGLATAGVISTRRG
ncbi:hypothetical protein E4198_00320 [Streptomyces sp. RKND-216]|nr:hypothetical protein E4198_00320 [Streptomyces sp. RKND-216]